MKTRKFFSIFIFLISTVLVLGVGFVPASAEETTQSGGLAPPPGMTTGTGGSTLSGNLYDDSTGIEDIGGQLPVTTTDDILNWATTKGNEIIYMLQIFCQPFAILIFIVAAFMTLIGCIGKGDMVGKGVWGMVMSVVVYAAVLYAPVILQTFVGWVAS